MSLLIKPVGYLAAFAATAGVAGCGAAVDGQGDGAFKVHLKSY